MESETAYQIEVELLSEAIFTGGEKQRNLVQAMALIDADGFVYMHGKSFKGHLKKQAFWLLKRYQEIDKKVDKQSEGRMASSFLRSLAVLFGLNESEIKVWELDIPGFKQVKQGSLKFGHLQLPVQVRSALLEQIKAMEKDSRESGDAYVPFSPLDLLAAQTNIRTRIQLQNGIVQDKKLASFHTVKKGLVFYSDVYFHPSVELDQAMEDQSFERHLAHLQRIIRSLDAIGAGVHRGRGQVRARLLFHGKEVNLNQVGGGSSEAIRSY